jgi:hypothetical protein
VIHVTETTEPRGSESELTLKALVGVGTEHLGMMLTLGYLAVTVVGMVSSWALYARFGVNVFHFAQIGDFLLAATAWPVASLSVVLALVAVAILFRVDRWGDRYRWYRRLYFDSERVRVIFRSKPMFAAYAVAYVWLATVLHADWYENRLRSGEGARVRVELQSGTYLGRMGTIPFEADLIGATTAYVFLYDRDSGRVTVVPVENLATLSPPVRGPE